MKNTLWSAFHLILRTLVGEALSCLRECCPLKFATIGARSLPIVVKEALAFVNTLQAGKTLVTNARVDAHTDNMAFLQSLEKQGGKNVQLNDALKKLHQPSTSTQ